MMTKKIMMQNNNKFYLSIIVFVVLLSIISCTPKSYPTELPLSYTNTSVSQFVAAPTGIATEELKVIEATPTYISTLDPDHAYLELEKIFRDNSCDFPCWWGIEPGETSISDGEF